MKITRAAGDTEGAAMVGGTRGQRLQNKAAEVGPDHEGLRSYVSNVSFYPFSNRKPSKGSHMDKNGTFGY